MIADETGRRAEAERPNRACNGHETRMRTRDCAGAALEKATLAAPSLPERVTGIEPALSAWEADVLPLNYTRAAWHLPRVTTAIPGLCCVRSDIVPDPVGCQGAPL